MGVTSVLLCQRCNPWQGLLLTASLLTCWHLSTTSKVTIELVPPQVVEGEDVLFLVHNLPENLTAFAWFKGRTNMKRGIALYALASNIHVHSDRETLYSNGSLIIHNITQKDRDYYTLRTFNGHLKAVSTTTTFLHVNLFLWNCGRFVTSAQPSIESMPSIITEGQHVLLHVHNLPENLQGFLWFKGMTVFRHFEIGRYIIGRKSAVFGPAYSGREKLDSDGSLLIKNVTQNDAGLYTLRVLGTDMKSEEAHVEIQVNNPHFQCCDSTTSSKLMIEAVPRYAAEGTSVLLLVHNLPEELISFTWYNSMYRVPAFKIVDYHVIWNITTWVNEYGRRGMVYANGSLLLQNIVEKDARMYTLETLNVNYTVERAHVQFYVNKAVTQPFVQITDTTVNAHRSVTFTCVTPDMAISILWFFNSHTLQPTERMTLSSTKCGLRIDDVRSEDAGEYQCVVTNRAGDAKASHPVWWP
ncbi:pregnancy-specific glycoprotein 22-like [Arvicanthis niloticus]|uniref:pregnancy-specific glycoprotein 22-like n=1 Tax=Arvicanthis niloticus TaxID=61156 RepID=UPI001487407D|nr:pregnancy-specific glycoprotein 22-like [Arvicanthis niloticus]